MRESAEEHKQRDGTGKNTIGVCRSIVRLPCSHTSLRYTQTGRLTECMKRRFKSYFLQPFAPGSAGDANPLTSVPTRLFVGLPIQ